VARAQPLQRAAEGQQRRAVLDGGVSEGAARFEHGLLLRQDLDD
jgi:hypothetical protein